MIRLSLVFSLALLSCSCLICIIICNITQGVFLCRDLLLLAISILSFKLMDFLIKINPDVDLK